MRGAIGLQNQKAFIIKHDIEVRPASWVAVKCGRDIGSNGFGKLVAILKCLGKNIAKIAGPTSELAIFSAKCEAITISKVSCCKTVACTKLDKAVSRSAN